MLQPAPRTCKYRQRVVHCIIPAHRVPSVLIDSDEGGCATEDIVGVGKQTERWWVGGTETGERAAAALLQEAACTGHDPELAGYIRDA